MLVVWVAPGQMSDRRSDTLGANRTDTRRPTMSTAQINGIEVYYEEHGHGDPLLLIMGLAADSVAWMFQLPDFSEHYRTIVFDNRGVGRSSKPAGPYTIAQMADDAAGLLDHARHRARPRGRRVDGRHDRAGAGAAPSEDGARPGARLHVRQTRCRRRAPARIVAHRVRRQPRARTARSRSTSASSIR